MKILLFTVSLILPMLAGALDVIRFSEASAKPAAPASYVYAVDLRNVKDDKLKVTLTVSGMYKQELIFCMPRIVPGIYGDMNFGTYLSEIQAYDFRGKPLEIVKLDENRWKILNAIQIGKITYTVDDGWEEFDTFKEGMYLSASSTFKEKEVFLINHNALFGYLEGFDRKNIQLQIKKPAHLYGATSLRRINAFDSIDYYMARDYHSLVDNPIMYARPDTTNFRIGDINVTVAVHATGGQQISAEIATHIRPLLQHQKNYLGGKLPVKNYTFLIYHNENPDVNSYMGDGLEHANSTLILMYMPWDPEVIKENVYGIASHEFFHTLIPLGLHSEEIEFYNFNHPVFSKHLWLYEGMTEYFTLHMPVKEKVQSGDEFLRALKRKIDQMEGFSNERSLTDLSVDVMDNQKDFYNFYLKGTLVNLCLDIRLRELSGGNYGVTDLISDMLKVHGPGKPFQDDKLFEELAQVSKHKELLPFFKDYVSGTAPLPLKESLAKAGIEFNPADNTVSWSKDPSEAQLLLRKHWIGL